MIKLTPEVDKQAIVQSVSLCPPGPHAILLVIPVGLFSGDYLSVLEEHMKLFSERAWRHTVVLFTWGDSLRDSAIKQHIERQGKTLRQLIEKCGHRYHVLSNRCVGDRTQVTALLKKIEGMVAANEGGHYEDDEKIFLRVGSIQEQRKEPESVKLLRRKDSKELVYPTMDGEEQRHRAVFCNICYSARDCTSNQNACCSSNTPFNYMWRGCLWWLCRQLAYF